MESINRIVISGSPATGKTTLIAALEDLGHTCFHEISRQIIQAELLVGSDVLPWDNLMAFSERVFKGRTEQFHAANSALCFYDRSVMDTLAYLNKDQLEIPHNWHKLAQENRYNQKVFITPPWRSIFENDHERRESWEEVLHVHEYLMTTYQSYGYEVVIVPKTTVKERVDFVLNNL